MNTKEISEEKISAFADGELPDQHAEIVLAALRQEGGRSNWEIYHQIGDVLRSDDMAIPLSASFATRMAARLEAEPVLFAPQAFTAPSLLSTEQATIAANPYKRSAKQWRVPSMVAAAAMAAIAFLATPQLMIALKGETISGDAVAGASVSSQNVEDVPIEAAASSASVVLRDPRIDDYLLAHQRFSPSVYSTAQYARSATFSSK